MVSIRRICPEDEQAVKDLITSVMNEEFHDAKAAYPTEDLDHIVKIYGGLGEAFFVAVLDGHKVVGTVAVKKEDNRVALMRRLFVSSSHRKQQIGVKLIDHVFHFCDEVGYQEIIFKTTSRMEGANKLCQKKGFIQRAKLNLGSMELLKFSKALRPVLKEARSAGSAR